MIRRSLSAAVLLLALGAKALGESGVDIVDLECFNDGKLVGRTSDLGSHNGGKEWLATVVSRKRCAPPVAKP